MTNNQHDALLLFLGGAVRGLGRWQKLDALDLRHRIIAGATEGVAAENAAQGQPAALERAVLAQGIEGVLRAGRGEPAGGGLQRGKADLVEADEQDERPRRDPPHSRPNARTGSRRPVTRHGRLRVFGGCW